MENLLDQRGDEKGKKDEATGGEKKPDPAAPGSTPPNGKSGKRFHAITFREGRMSHADLLGREVLAMDGADVDFFWDRVFDRVRIRYADGTSSGMLDHVPLLGPDVGIPFLEDILWAEGAFLTVDQLNGRLGEIRNNSQARAQQVKRIRRAFHDTPKLSWYFKVKAHPWRIAWNIARSWMIVER